MEFAKNSFISGFNDVMDYWRNKGNYQNLEGIAERRNEVNYHGTV